MREPFSANLLEHQKMNAARAYRKLKVQEEKKLANRLQLLRAEIAKSQKAIEHAQKKIEQVETHRQELDERAQLKSTILEEKAKEQQHLAHVHAKTTARMRELRISQVQGIQAQKKEQRQSVHEERQQNRQLIQQQKERELKRAVEVKKLIRKQQLDGKEHRRQALVNAPRDVKVVLTFLQCQAHKREEARAEFNARVQEEAERTREAEKKVANMEAEELKLIKELEKVQGHQVLSVLSRLC